MSEQPLLDDGVRIQSAPAEKIKNHQDEKTAISAKDLRVEQVGRLLAHAYEGAGKLKLKEHEIKALRQDFPDDAIEVRPHDGVIYISHMNLRERLWDVFGPGQVSEICRERMVRTDTNEIAVDLVLVIRGAFVAEGIGTAKFYPNNPNANFGDVVESAWSDALRRCCKKFGVGTQAWRPGFIRDFKAKNPTRPLEKKSVFKKPAPAPKVEDDEDDRIPF
jgi:genome maintenance protein MGM101